METNTFSRVCGPAKPLLLQREALPQVVVFASPTAEQSWKVLQLSRYFSPLHQQGASERPGTETRLPLHPLLLHTGLWVLQGLFSFQTA